MIWAWVPQRQQRGSGENSCGVTPKDCPGEGLLWGSAELLRGGLEQGHYTSCWRGAWECEGGRILGAAHYCVIGSVPLQQLQLAAVRKTRMPMAEATSAPGAAYLGPCCPPARAAQRQMDRVGCQSPRRKRDLSWLFSSTQPSAVQLAKKPMASSLCHRLHSLYLE